MAVRGTESQSDGSYYMQLSPGTHKIGARHRYPGRLQRRLPVGVGGNLRIETDADNGIG